MYKLTLTQREVLMALVELYEKHKRMVKSKEVAELINKDEGTVRNIISGLKSIGLVESKTGPSGGYMPTLKAFELLKRPSAPGLGYVRVYKGDVELNLAVINLELLDLLNPEGARAVLRVTGDFSQVSVNDKLRIGPTPYSRVFLEGVVTHIDVVSGQISLYVTKLAAIPREYVGNIASHQLIILTPNQKLQEAAKIFYNNRIRGAPVMDKGRLVGVLTATDLARAIAEGRTDSLVKDYMTRETITIREDEDILKAIKLMNTHDIGRLIVVDSTGRVTGVITRTDILKRISGL